MNTEYQGSFPTKKQAENAAAKIIGGGITQKQGKVWVVFALKD